MVDYPNSKKARKVFLCLFVGSGGSVGEVPRGLEGDVSEVNGENGKVVYERRREKEGRRVKGGKRKDVKTKDWILKKKEVSAVCSHQAILTFT